MYAFYETYTGGLVLQIHFDTLVVVTCWQVILAASKGNLEFVVASWREVILGRWVSLLSLPEMLWAYLMKH